MRYFFIFSFATWCFGSLLWCCFMLLGLGRAINLLLALTLLVAWVLADNHDATVATDDLALVANLLDAWVYLHVSCFCLGLLLTVFQTDLADWLNQKVFICIGR